MTSSDRPIRPGWYRGVKLQRPVVPPRIPSIELHRAVEEAVRENLPMLSVTAPDQDH